MRSRLAGTSLLAPSAPSATASVIPAPFSDTAVGATTFTAPSAGTCDITTSGDNGSGGAGGGSFDAGLNPLFSLAPLSGIANGSIMTALSAWTRRRSCPPPT